jgi:hypothetical protein
MSKRGPSCHNEYAILYAFHVAKNRHKEYLTNVHEGSSKHTGTQSESRLQWMAHYKLDEAKVRSTRRENESQTISGDYDRLGGLFDFVFLLGL